MTVSDVKTHLWKKRKKEKKERKKEKSVRQADAADNVNEGEMPNVTVPAEERKKGV